MISLNTSDNPIVSILILSQDNLEMLRDCLASISQTVDGAATPFEVIVLFQQTSRQSADALLTGVQGVRALHSRLNLGFGGGNNFAARFTNGKYLLFLNDDTITQTGWLSALLETAQRDQGVGAVGSRLVFPSGMLQEAGAIVWSDGSCFALGRGEPPDSRAYMYRRDVAYASANGLLVRRETFERAQGFDERYFPGYYEDVDLCFTIRHVLKERVVYEPRSVITHRESSTANRDPDFRTFLFQRHQAKFQSKWERALASCPPAQPESRKAVERAVLRFRGNPKQVLIVDDRVPRVGMGSGAGRTADLLSDVTAAGFAVAFAPTDRSRLPSGNTLGDMGVDLVAEPLQEHLARGERTYDVVVISRPHNFQAFHAAVRRTMPQARVIYDVEALYHRRLFLQAHLERDPALRERIDTEADRMEALETQIACAADRLVAISDSEVQWLRSIDRHAPIEFMRPLANGIEMTQPSIDGRAGAVFIAGWLAGEQSPNVEALRWYAQEIIPRVRTVLPDFVTYVSGGNPPLSVQGMASEALVLVGFIEHIEALYRTARIAIAPILAGAGVKIKTIEALQYGVPVVATSIGAEGLGLSDGEDIDVSDDPDVFAQRVIALASNNDLWQWRREQLAKRVAQWKLEHLTWSKVMAMTLEQPPTTAVIA